MTARDAQGPSGALATGSLVGAAAVLPLWGLEVAWLLLDRTLDGSDAARFAMFDLGMLLVAGVTLGGLLALALSGIRALAEQLGKTRDRAAAWETLLWTLATVPAAAYLATRMFDGRRARLMPGRHLIAAAVGLAALAFVAVGVRVAVAVRARVPRMRATACVALVGGLWLGAGALAWTDSHVLGRLYPALHATLAAGAFVLAGLAAATLALRRPASAHAPALALGVLLAGLCATTTGASVERLRAAALEQAPLGGKVLALLPSVERPATIAEAPPRPGPHVIGPRLPARDIVLITVDALRADRLGAWGSRRGITPNLDRLAASSTVFLRAYCQAPHTSFSITTLLTGQYAHTRAALGLPARVDTLPEVLRRFGYKTAAFFPPAVFFIDGERFREYDEGRYGFEYVKYQHLDGPGRTSQALTFLEEAREAPRVFLWVHYFEPHEPYVRHPDFDFGPSAPDRYDGEVAAVDREIGRLVDALDRARPKAIVLVTADHGEEFGEHGGHYHGTTLYDEQARVPLIVRVPGTPPRRVDGPVGTVDVAPTLLSLVDVPPPSTMTGGDLGPWIAGADPTSLPAAFSEVLSRRMAARGRHKLIVDFSARVSELYDLVADPAERRNLIDALPRRAAELRAEIDERLARIAGLNDRTARKAAIERARAGDPTALPEILALLKNGDPEARREAADLLFAIVAEPARESIEAHMDEPDPELAHRTALAGARLGIPRAVERTRRLLKRTDLPGTMRQQAALALAERRITDGIDVLIEMTAATERFEDRQAATRALGSLRDSRAVPTLLRLLADVRMRRFAIGALGSIGDRRAVEPLLALLERDRFISVREAAARALGDLADRRAARRLRSQLDREPERPVIAEILPALARLGALPRGARHGSDLWLVLRADRAGPASVAIAGADMAVIETRAGLGATLVEGVTPGARVTVTGAELVGTWWR